MFSPDDLPAIAIHAAAGAAVTAWRCGASVTGLRGGAVPACDVFMSNAMREPEHVAMLLARYHVMRSVRRIPEVLAIEACADDVERLALLELPMLTERVGTLAGRLILLENAAAVLELARRLERAGTLPWDELSSFARRRRLSDQPRHPAFSLRRVPDSFEAAPLRMVTA